MKKRLLYFSMLLIGMFYQACQCSKNKNASHTAKNKVEEAPVHKSPDQQQVDSLKNTYNKHPK
ncbi:MAG: hypothetical protein JNL65_02990 [Saprospiraceae bacterium]|nr:hypothetical protein [Saprospiraceae bacterium]HRG68156.1 hypothetical protein [Saprospiraceae bacterium]